MNFKRFHESKNLFDASTVVKGRINTNTGAIEYPTDTTAFVYDSADNEFTITTSLAWRGFVSDYIDVQEFLLFSCVSDKTLYTFEYAYDNNRTFANSSYIQMNNPQREAALPKAFLSPCYDLP